MIKLFTLFAVILFSPGLMAQVVSGDTKNEIPIELEEIKTIRTELVSTGGPAPVVNFSMLRLVNMAGEKVELDPDRITIVEYWSRNSAKQSLYWNRMRELEHQYADSKEVQVISINYDYALGGEHQRLKAGEFLKDWTPPKELYFDTDDAMGEIFGVPGTMGYMLFSHKKEYLFVGRGDDPVAEKMFKILDSALESQRFDFAAAP